MEKRVFQLKVTLCRTKPPIWRRLEVPADTTLGRLHDVVQIAMGWFDCHLHQFVAKGVCYGPPDPESGPELENENKVRLDQVLRKAKDKLVYEYDFGDGWYHDIVLEKALPASEEKRYPMVTGGRGACPPEDCGGIGGFYRMLETLGDPAHSRHEEMDECFGGDYDPKAFDLEAVNRTLSGRKILYAGRSQEPRPMIKARNNSVYQFRIVLREIEPPIWRVIQTPSHYSFWDLHVAIQDAMGWLDSHLHAFRVRMPHKSRETVIGIPDDDLGLETLPGWEFPIAEYFTEPGKTALYEYDFGDSWLHDVLLEGILLKDKTLRYPRCIDGGRACPPEDCGGVPGYQENLEILAGPKGPEYRERVEWLKGHLKNYWPYEPDHFDPDDVKFENPKRRWKIAFSNM